MIWDVMKIIIVTPAAPKSLSGNRNTAVRWARFLRGSGHEVAVKEDWDGEEADLMIALHARRSYPSIKYYSESYPGRPLIVALTGTDLYRDIRTDENARYSLELATCLVVLQEAALDELEDRNRRKIRVIYQSAEPIETGPTGRTLFRRLCRREPARGEGPLPGGARGPAAPSRVQDQGLSRRKSPGRNCSRRKLGCTWMPRLVTVGWAN